MGKLKKRNGILINISLILFFLCILIATGTGADNTNVIQAEPEVPTHIETKQTETKHFYFSEGGFGPSWIL